MTDVPARPRVYLDTNVFIRDFEGAEAEAKPLRELFDALRLDAKRAVTSELTLAEVLAPSKNGPELHIKRRFYLALIASTGFIDLLPINRSILIETADLRKVAKHRLPDAIHVVTAIRAGCGFFMSSDRDMKKLPKGMRLIPPDSTGIATLLGATNA
ncbi:type II toxin-antitoxin system VapC family toxin [Methylocella sp.]|jgi:predicted nucleic acid-binding protein|uniref:type II toxin-antitoxin system VapC family toxin n=1 Tax=Methylocella sp. TaxID=1978226 RepID=UPI003C20DC4A